MYHPTSRVLTVLALLQAHQQLSGPELAARLEVDVRTVRRYVAMLQDMGVPVEASTGRFGGYTLRPGYRLPPLMFSDDEALALALGLLLARRAGLADAAPATEGALAKLGRVLPAALGAQVQALQAALALDGTPADPAVAPAILARLSLAVHGRRPVQIRYVGKGDPTERVVEPYGVVRHGGRWYTVGYCHLRGDVRVFRLDRIMAVQPHDGTFSPPAGFDSLAEVQRSFASIPDRWDIAVVLHMPLAEARTRLPGGMALLEPHSDGTLIRASLDRLDLPAQVLAGLGATFVVLEPPELRDALIQHAATIAACARAAANKEPQ